MITLRKLFSTKSLYLAVVLSTAGSLAFAAQGNRAEDPAAEINTLVGTSGGGNNFPGPDVPFGMIQWGPDSYPDRNVGGGYEITDKLTSGFSLTHLSGTGCSAYGDFPVLPMVGGLPSGDPGQHNETILHEGEVGQAGYYSVRTGDGTIRTELTTALRAAMARFTFPATSQADLLIKLQGSASKVVDSGVTVVSDTEITGWTTSGFFCGAQDKYTVYFDLVFDRPFAHSQVVNGSRKKAALPNVLFLTFDATKSQTVQAKAAVSWVSVDNARANLRAEAPDGHWDFEGMRASAHSAWNTFLNKIEIEGGAPTERQLFYTSLYHVLLHPNVFSDVNGQYMGFDNAVHTVSGGQQAQYANYSGWDVYHGQVPLSALVAPQEMSDSAQSMVNDAAQNGGRLPKWALANGESYIMVGDPADPILAGYYAFGARAFDTKQALYYMDREATRPNPNRPGLNYLDQYGFLPQDASYDCCGFYGQVSTLLEYSIADYAVSQFATALGDDTKASFFLKRAQSWQNVFNPSNQFFSPKFLNGTFQRDVKLTTGTGMVEGSASQYRWIIPYNRRAFINAYGGFDKVNKALDALFTNLDDWDGNGALLTNEFDIGVQYWYNYTGQPWKTQEVANRVRTQLYRNEPVFLGNNAGNNDDLGTMSAQLVWSMLGVFPTVPGRAVLAINGPQFPAARLHLPNGSVLTIKGAGASAKAPYVQSLNVDGQPYNSVELNPEVLTRNTTLDFTMGAQPNTQWGAAPAESAAEVATTAAIGFVDADQVVLPERANLQLVLGAQSTRDDLPQTISWTATADSGVTLNQTSGTLTLSARGRSTQPLLLTASANEGRYLVKFELHSSSGVAIAPVVLAVTVAKKGNLWPYFNHRGVVSQSAPNSTGFDDHGNSYAAEALAAAGVQPGQAVQADGLTYHWPAVKAGDFDHLQVGGETFVVNQDTAKHTLGLLGAATNAGSGSATGTLTVHYADNTTQDIALTFNDWASCNAAGNQSVVAKMGYRLNAGGRDVRETCLFSFHAPLTGNKPVSSVTFPSAVNGGEIRVFDVAFE